ncbi:MAG: biotin transporter BioY [Bacteroidota bacterium]
MNKLVPQIKSWTGVLSSTAFWEYTLVQAFCLSWFLVLAAQIKVPFYPVQMTMHDWAIMLVALLAARRVAMGAVLLFLSYPVIGLPVFDVSGFALFFDPTAGYLIGFILMTTTVTTLKEHYPAGRFWTQLGIAFVGSVVLFTAGLSWLAYLMGWPMALQVGLLPFLGIQPMKIVLAAALSVYWSNWRA